MQIIDGIGQVFQCPVSTKRIVSVVPSQTELLAYLGLDQEVVGITKFCVHPNTWFKSKQRIGGTKKLHLEAILRLNPDIIFANKEENDRTEIEWLQARVPVYVSDIVQVNDALVMIRDIGAICEKIDLANRLVDDIQHERRVFAIPTGVHGPALYLIWKDPYMTVSADTFIHHMLEEAGFENALEGFFEGRYPALELSDIIALRPKFIFLSSEPFPFGMKEVHQIKEALPDSKVVLVNGELFSWYGPRMRDAFGYMATLS
jgi:ABC-type Fe3+-hydroxamate transport system substrate-binding protein